MALIKPTDLGNRFLMKHSTPADRSLVSGVQLYNKQVGSDGTGNTVFTLTNPYLPGTNTLWVFLNGQRLTVGEDYTESNSYQVTLASVASDTDVLEFFVVGQYKVASAELAGAFASTVAVRNLLINPQFTINQRVSAGGALGANVYFYDRWSAGSGGATVSLSGDELTISAGSIRQRVESVDMIEGEYYTIDHDGTAQVYDWDATAYVDCPLTFKYTAATWGTDCAISFSTGTVIKPRLSQGGFVPAFSPRRWSDELRLCLRYFQKTYGYTIAPGSINNLGLRRTLGTGANVINGEGWPGGPMRTAPTIVAYSPVTGAAGYIRDNTAAADVQVSGYTHVGSNGFAYLTLATSPASGNPLWYHWTAVAEL